MSFPFLLFILFPPPPPFLRAAALFPMQRIVWIGYERDPGTGLFQWLDGSPLNGYTNWRPGQPTGDCGALHGTGGWTGFACDGIHMAMCEAKTPLPETCPFRP